MHRSHSTCTFHRTFPLAGHDDPFFLWPLFPGNSRTQSIGADRNQLSVFRVFTRTLATRHSLSQHIDDFFITGGKTAKVMKGHSSIVKKERKKSFGRGKIYIAELAEKSSTITAIGKAATGAALTLFIAFSESKQLLKPLLPRFTDKSSMTVREPLAYIHTPRTWSLFSRIYGQTKDV